jgi:outer membrane protein assembly factor BamB
MLNVRAVLIPLLSAALLVVGVSSCKRNRPPDVPAVPTGPSVCFKDTTYTFKAIATDLDGDSVAVRFVWSDGPTSSWSGWFASGGTAALTHAWPDTGTYEVRVQAKDQKLRTSGWSDTLIVRVVLPRPPQTPAAPTGPDKGGQDSSYAFAAVAFHPDGISVAIRFSWGDGDTTDWSPYVASGESVKMSHVWSTPDTYLATVQAKDTGNALSEWSAPHAIVIRPPDTLSKWRFQLAAGEEIYMYSSPAIGPDGTIYVGSSDSSLYAVNPDGTLKWSFPTADEVRSSPSIAADGTVYFGSEDSYLYALNPDGTLKWRYETGKNVGSSPSIAADGTVYFGSDDHFLYALNPDSTLKWRYQTGGDVDASPAVGSDGTIYAGSDDDHLYALNPDGTLKWRYDVNGNVRSSPAIAADGTVYVGSYDNKVYSLRALNPDGTLKWGYPAGFRVRSSPAIASDGTVYIGSDYNSLHALNPDGTLKWRYQTGSNVDASPAIASDGTVYFGSNDDCIYALNPDSTLKWRYETGADVESSPTIGEDGTVYFTSGDGYLYALKSTSPLADSPWPKFHHDLKNTGRVGGGR